MSPLFSWCRADGRRLHTEQDPQNLHIHLDGRRLGALARDGAGPLVLDLAASPDAPLLVLAALQAAFAVRPATSLRLQPGDPVLAQALLRAGIVEADGSEGLLCQHAMFLQQPQNWLAQAPSSQFPLSYRVSQGKRHPLRAPRAEGEVYRCRVAALEADLSLRTLDIERDLADFSRWQNDPRVAAFWEMSGSVAEHRDYLEKLLADPKTQPLIGCFDDQPFGYFEAYWAKEDRIAPYYAVDDYDRGVHMLVGEQRFRGPHRIAAWLPALAHFFFLDDARTQRVVAEPRADNQKMIGYMQQAGFYREKDFDFPHKRAAMMILPREVFFG